MFPKKLYYYFTFATLFVVGIGVSLKNDTLIYPKNRYICLKNEYSPPKKFISYTVAWCFEKDCKHRISKTIVSGTSELINHKLQYNKGFYDFFGEGYQGYSSFINLRWEDDEGEKSQMVSFKNEIKENYCTAENTYYFWKELIPTSEKTRIVLKTINQIG